MLPKLAGANPYPGRLAVDWPIGHEEGQTGADRVVGRLHVKIHDPQGAETFPDSIASVMG